MSTIPKIVADFETQLATAVAIGGTSFSISSALDDDGIALPDGTYCFTVDNGSSVKEYLMGVLAGTSVTGVKSISRQSAETTGAVRAHRVGASVIITDFIAIARIADILAGTTPLDGASPLGYDVAPTLSDPKQLATVEYVLSVVTGGTVFFSSQIINGTAGETVAAPKIGYLKAADQRWWLSDKDTAATYSRVRLGIFQGSANAGGGVAVQLSGIAGGFSGLSAGTKYYLGDDGAVTTTPGLADVYIGTAVSSTTILLELGNSLGPNEIQKDFLSGVIGMIIPFAGTVAPTGFLACDGSAVSRTTYAALFAVISTTYGVGDGSTTFNVPDLRGRIIIGAGTGTKVATFASRASNVLTVTGLSDKANNEFQTGQAVTYHTAGTVITGLTNDTLYYLIRISNTTFSLASSLANAQNGTAISLSSDGSGVQTFTLALTARSAGETGGEENHAMSSTELLSHYHPTSNNQRTGGGGQRPSDAAGSTYQNGTEFTGGNAAMNNMQPFSAITFLIKT